jgi:hypothetical protein
MWEPPVEPSPAEQAMIKAVRRAKLFVFLREHRHELFDEQFQAELAEAYLHIIARQQVTDSHQLAALLLLDRRSSGPAGRLESLESPRSALVRTRARQLSDEPAVELPRGHVCGFPVDLSPHVHGHAAHSGRPGGKDARP